MTELEAVVEALKQLGGEAHYTEIAKVARPLLPHSTSKTFVGNIRRTLYTHCKESPAFLGKEDAFYPANGISSKSGIWGLKNFQPTIKNMDITQDDSSFPEGKEVLKQHIVRERNKHLIDKAKEAFKKTHGGKLYCEVCGFDFSYHYPSLGDGFIEVHHIKPVSKMKAGEKTKISDLVMVCSNCHSMIHRKKPWLTKTQLAKIYKK